VLMLLAMLGTGSETVRAGINVWTSLGPGGGPVQTLAIDAQNPSTVYAVASGGIFKTTDGGKSWRQVYFATANDGGAAYPATVPATVLAIDPQNPTTVYAGTNQGGVVKSEDGGTNWTMVNSGLTGLRVYILAVDPQNPRTLYAGTAGTNLGLFKSTDGGESWTSLPYLPRGVAFALVIDPQNPNTVYAGSNEDTYQRGNSVVVFKSTDGGASWRDTGLPPGGFAGALAIDPVNPSTLYAGACVNNITSGARLFKSTDGGASWTTAISGPPISCIEALAIDPQNSSTVYAGTGSGVFKSADGGTSWSAVNSGLAATVVKSLAVDPQTPSTLYAGTGSGVFKSADGGTGWSGTNSGLNATYVNSLAVDPQNLSTLYATAAGSVLKTTNGGVHWSEMYSAPASDGGGNYPASSLVIDPQVSSTVYAGARPGGVWKSTDAGASWTRTVMPKGNGVHGVAIAPQNPNTVYAWNHQGLFKSSDGAASWSTVNLHGVLALAIDPQSPDTVYAGIGYGGVFKSTDGGASWSAVSSGLPTTPNGVAACVPNSNAYVAVTILVIDPQNPSTLFAQTGGPGSISCKAAGIYKSTDGGTTWSAANSGFGFPGPVVTTLAIDPQNSSTVYAANGGGIFKSADGGASWSAVNSGLTTLNVQTLAIDPQNPSTLYAGTNGGGVFAITFFP
jgi:photosystem II stability/assembly factor-like uncharacterized protein